MTFPDSRTREMTSETEVLKPATHFRHWIAATMLLAMVPLSCAVWTVRVAIGQIAVQNQGYVPFSEPPINYRSQPTNDPVSRLEKRLESGQASLEWEPKNGYLRSVLKELNISSSSQTLVFSKT